MLGLLCRLVDAGLADNKDPTAPHQGSRCCRAPFIRIHVGRYVTWIGKVQGRFGDCRGNDNYGCCVEAGMNRLARMCTRLAQGRSWTPTDGERHDAVAVGLAT